MAKNPKFHQAEKGLSDLLDYVKERFEFLLNLVKNKIDEIKKAIIKRIILISLLWFGSFFILLAIAQKLAETFPSIKASGGLFIVGAILVVISLIFYAGIRK